MTYIFESPDGGDTIYRRAVGTAQRELYSVSPNKQQQESLTAQWLIWRNILEAAQHNPALQDALDRARIIYSLSKND